MVSVQDDELSEFVSPFLRDSPVEETVIVTPEDPGRNKKVYVIKKEAGLTGRSYIHCSSCHHRAFRLFRNVTRLFAPDHLKHCGSSDNEVLRFCRTCWFRVNNPKQDDKLASRPNFERGPLGITDQRACFSWHFVQRDFVRKKFSELDGNGNEVNIEMRLNGKNQLMMPLVTVVSQDGSEFIEKDCNGNMFDYNGREVSTLNESGYLSNECSPTNDNQSPSSILINIHKDHDYAPAMQREIEVTTTAGSPVKNYFHGNSMGRPSLRRELKAGEKRAYKVKYNKDQVKHAVKKLLKRTSLHEGPSRQSNNLVTVNLPVGKVEEELKSKREKGEAPNPNHLIGLKATAADGQTLPGLICPLCGKYTVKSYSVWKKDNAPAKIVHLFKDGVTVIRACRRCVPYPVNREKEKKKIERNLNARTMLPRSTTTNRYHGGNGVKPVVNGCIVKNGKKNALVSTVGGEKAKDINQNINQKSNTKATGQSPCINGPINMQENERGENFGEPRGNDVESEEELLRKKARIEEKKRTIEEESGRELTGLECFESMQSEERIEDVSGDEESSLLCNEVRKDLDLVENGESGTRRARGRPSKRTPLCDKCNTILGTAFHTIKLSDCPKKFTYFFRDNRNRRIMKICNDCHK